MIDDRDVDIDGADVDDIAIVIIIGIEIQIDIDIYNCHDHIPKEKCSSKYFYRGVNNESYA